MIQHSLNRNMTRMFNMFLKIWRKKIVENDKIFILPYKLDKKDIPRKYRYKCNLKFAKKSIANNVTTTTTSLAVAFFGSFLPILAIFRIFWCIFTGPDSVVAYHWILRQNYTLVEQKAISLILISIIDKNINFSSKWNWQKGQFELIKISIDSSIYSCICLCSHCVCVFQGFLHIDHR